MKREVLDTLLLHHRVDLLEQISQVKWVELRHLEDLLVRDDDELRLALPVVVEAGQASLIVQVRSGCVLLLPLGTIAGLPLWRQWRTLGW